MATPGATNQGYLRESILRGQLIAVVGFPTMWLEIHPLWPQTSIKQTCRKSSSAVALLRAEQGPCGPSDFASKFGEQ